MAVLAIGGSISLDSSEKKLNLALNLCYALALVYFAQWSGMVKEICNQSLTFELTENGLGCFVLGIVFNLEFDF